MRRGWVSLAAMMLVAAPAASTDQDLDAGTPTEPALDCLCCGITWFLVCSLIGTIFSVLNTVFRLVNTLHDTVTSAVCEVAAKVPVCTA